MCDNRQGTYWEEKKNSGDQWEKKGLLGKCGHYLLYAYIKCYSEMHYYV